MTVNCPVCGGSILEETGIVIIPRLCVVLGAGRKVRLTPGEMVILGVLAKAAPLPLNLRQLFTAVYGLRPDGGPDSNILYVRLSNIRPKLRPVGLDIMTVTGSGWRLSRPVRIVEDMEGKHG